MRKAMLKAGLACAVLCVACGPSINPKTKAIVDAWKSGLSNAGGHYKAAGIQRPAFAAGQWAQYVETDKEGRPAQVTYKILGEESGAVWLETERVSYFDQVVTKMLVSAPDWQKPEGWEFRRVISQKQGKPAQEMPPFVMSMIAKPMVSMLRFEVQNGPAETVVVPAGTFEGAVKNDVHFESMVGSVNSEVWLDGVVPVTGYVKSQTQDGSFKTELVAFANQGATSAISGPIQGGMH